MMRTQGTHNTHSNESGFTLVELMVVLVILTIGLLPLAIIQTRAQQDVFEAGQYSEAVQVAQMQMEQSKAMGFGNVQADSGMVDGVFTWRQSITNVSFGLDQVAVTVSWDEKGSTRAVQVVDRISFR